MVKESLEDLARNLRNDGVAPPWTVNITRIGMDMLKKELGVEDDVEEFAGVRLILGEPQLQEQSHG